MNTQEYYHSVIDRLRNCYHLFHYFIATGSELSREGCDPLFPAHVLPLSRLEEYILNREVEVHLPVIGEYSQSVLMPLDFELYLGSEQHRLYADREAHKRLFRQMIPVTRFIEEIFRSRGMPYLLDFTPSGGHILFQNVLGYRATEELIKIGYLEGDLVGACNYRDSGDIRRRHGISLDAASVFSGLTKIAEYVALLIMEAFRDNESRGLLPVTISNSFEHCINLDNTWSEGSPFMRAIRSPFSLHRKNRDKYGKHHQPSLVDVIGTCFDGTTSNEEDDLDFIQGCMWDLEKASLHAQRFSGYIPCSNETLIDFIGEYRNSDLYIFHQDFDRQEDIPRGMALEYARREDNIPDWTRHILYFPNPSALQPQKLLGFVYDFLIYAQWKPRHIANILRDMYQDPTFNWVQDFYRYPAEEKANYWARTYSSVALWKTGHLHISNSGAARREGGK